MYEGTSAENSAATAVHELEQLTNWAANILRSVPDADVEAAIARASTQAAETLRAELKLLLGQKTIDDLVIL